MLQIKVLYSMYRTNIKCLPKHSLLYQNYYIFPNHMQQFNSQMELFLNNIFINFLCCLTHVLNN